MRRLLPRAFLSILLLMAVAPICAGAITEVWRSPANMCSPRALSVDAGDGSVWVADFDRGQAIHIAADGTELLRKGGIPGAVGIGADEADGSVWVLVYWGGDLLHLASDGSELWRGSEFSGFMMVSVAPTDGSVWLGGARTLVHLAADGTEIGRYTHPSGYVALPSADPNDGSCWASITGTTTVVHVASDGTLLWHTDSMPGSGSVSVNPTDGSCWTCGGTADTGRSQGYVSTVIHFSADGDELWRRDGWWEPDGGPWLAVNPEDGSCWIVHNLHTTPDSVGITLVDVGGTVRAQHLLGDTHIAGIASDHGDSSLWLALQSGFVVHLVARPDGSPFWDVGGDHWAVHEITACATAGVVGGYPDGDYHPELAVTRGQIAVYISRALAGGEDSVPGFTGVPTFPDVDADFWALDHVEYAVDANVVAGYGDGLYHPEHEVTRDQMAVYVARAMVAPTGEAALADYVPADPRNFPDVPNTGYGDSGTDPYWAYTHVEYCVERGVVQGYDDGYYYPENPVTRDQMAVYVARAFALPI